MILCCFLLRISFKCKWVGKDNIFLCNYQIFLNNNVCWGFQVSGFRLVGELVEPQVSGFRLVGELVEPQVSSFSFLVPEIVNKLNSKLKKSIRKSVNL